MITSKPLSFSEKIKWRIRLLWASLILMIVYMIVMAEMGFGDQRLMTRYAHDVGAFILFGGMIYIICRIISSKKLLREQWLRKEKMLEEMDERNRYLHDKSGGIVWDILLICLLFVTLTTAHINMPAFYTSAALLYTAIIIKIAAYLYYRFRR